MGVTAHHVAATHGRLTTFLQLLVAGQEIVLVTRAMTEQRNADHAQRYAACTRAETIALLKADGEAAASAIRALSDGQLGRVATVWEVHGPMTTQQLIENHLIGHIERHLQSITAVLSA